MELERFREIRALYDRVIDLPLNEREGHLRELQLDEATIAEVMALMVKSETAFAAELAAPMKNLLIAAAPAPGSVLGVWRLMREIGRGGMGAVYLVERCDGHFEQTAALKFLKGLPSAERQDYFTRERQLLARLTHPNIARLYDGGATGDGQPWLVMEYVDGLNIDDYCRARALQTDAILKLFVEACHGVAFAHRQLIVHCDIKPSNLLVNAEGRAILLDFGIARLTDPALPLSPTCPTSPATTASAVQAYTPRYSSPEQREGGHVSTLSDIYSLGVLLNELLTAVAKPVGKSVGKPDRELAAIVSRATHTDPQRRYASVDALTDDLNRYQTNQPVQALPATYSYVARKLLVRRWPLVLAGAAFVATVAGFTAKVVVESQRAIGAEQRALNERDRAKLAEGRALAERDATVLAQAETLRERDRATEAEKSASAQRDRAIGAEQSALKDRDTTRLAQVETVRQRDRARQTSDFLVSIFDASRPNAEFGDVPASRLITLAEDRVERELAGQAETQAELFGVLATVQAIMGNSNKARENYQRAIVLERKLNRPLALAALLDKLAILRVSQQGVTGAEAEAREALALYEKHAPNTREAAETMASLGHILSILGKFDEGGKLLYRALAMQEAMQKQHQSNASAGVATVLISLGQHSMRIDQPVLAIEQFRRGLGVTATLVGDEHPRYLSDEEVFVRALNATQNHAEAETRARRILALRRKLDGDESNNVGTILNELARVLASTGRTREAIPLFEEGAAIHAKRSGKQSTRYALMLNNIANVHFRMGNLHKAVPLMEEAVAIVEQTVPSDADLTVKARMRSNLGMLHNGVRQPERAMKPLQLAYETRRAALGDEHALTIESELRLADAVLQTGKLADAVSRLARIKARTPIKDPIDQLTYDRLSALVEAERGNLDAAISQLAAIEERRFKALGTGSISAWIATLDRAELLHQRNGTGDRAEAARLAATVIENIRQSADPDAPAVLRAARLQGP